MTTITIALFGDYWINPAEIEEKIRSLNAHETIYLDFQSEGVSVNYSGIVGCLLKICQDTGRSVDSIKLLNNPNVLESSPFENINATRQSNQIFRSHFLSGDLLRSYWTDVPTLTADAHLFGLFIGRRTVARDMILQQCLQFPDKFLFSMMHNPMGIQKYDQADILEWTTDDRALEFNQWRQALKISSLDGKSVTDQYRRFVDNPTTNNSILSYYDRFLIELVPETYTRGDSFFPTEKTARPIMAEKPILVYGPKNFLARMRDLYGYLTYEDYWDESYDQLEGPERWRAMWKTMQGIAPDIINSDIGKITQHNRSILEQMKEWKI